MNDLGFRNRTDEFTDDHRDDRPVDRDTQKPQKLRRGVRRRWGMRLFGAGTFLLLAGGVTPTVAADAVAAQPLPLTIDAEYEGEPAPTIALPSASTATIASDCAVAP